MAALQYPAVFAFALLAAIHHSPAQSETVVPGYLADFSCSSGPFKLSLPGNPAQLAGLGRIRAVHIDKVENWGSFSSITKTLSFDGLSLKILTFSNDNSIFQPVQVNVYRPGWQITGPFQAGDLASTIHQQLGPNLLAENDELGVAGDDDKLRIKVKRARVVEIEYQCRVD